MKNLVLMIKLNRSSQRLAGALSHAKDSYETGEERFYYTTDNDTEIISDLQSSLTQTDWSNCKIVFITYVHTREIIATHLYIGDVTRLEHQKRPQKILCNRQHMTV